MNFRSKKYKVLIDRLNYRLYIIEERISKVGYRLYKKI